MKIDRALNLVVPVERDGGTLYVHSMPIRQETFEQFWKPIAVAYAAMFAERQTVFGAPRVAALQLKETAEALGLWEDRAGQERIEIGVKNGLMAEIRRLTNVVVGDDVIPLDEAKARQLLSLREVAEVENLIVFFILVSAMSRERELEPMLSVVSAMWNAQITSLNVTEFRASLPTSNADANTGVRPSAAPPTAAPGETAPPATGPVPNALADGKPFVIPY